MLEAGKKLQERYRVERQIGQGGMGSVYLATDERFGSTVAIKETLIADDNFRKALKREARLLNSLKHTALPKVSDHFIEDNGQYIVMEYIAGEDLYTMMEHAGTAFPFEDVKIWAEQLLDALEYLHSQETPIIHRDIKPQNLKLTPHGQIILLDFGLAKGNPTDANHNTAGHSIFGYSRHYASLEQIQGTGTDPRSDIYSLAATLYHLVTGKPPADAITRAMMVMNEDEDPLVSADSVHEQVDPDFAYAIRKCMSLNANLRPQSASEMFELIFGEQRTVVTQKTRPLRTDPEDSAVSTQNTKVFPLEGASDADRQSEIRTELLAGGSTADDSVETRIAKQGTSIVQIWPSSTQGTGAETGGFLGRSKLAAAALIAFALVAVSLASFVFFSEPGPVSFENNSDSPKAGTDLSNSGTEGTAVLGNQEMGNVLELDPETPSAAEEQTSSRTEGAIETQSKVKKTDAAGGLGSDIDTNAFEAEMNALERDLKSDMRVKRGRVETDNLIVDDSGVFLKNPDRPGAPNTRLPVTREEFDALTPAQKRRLRNLIELRRRMEAQKRLEEARRPVIVRPSPPPAPSP